MMLSSFLLTLFFWLPIMAAAQQPATQAPDQQQTPAPVQAASPVGPAAGPQATASMVPHAPSGQIQLDVVVTDKAGNPVAGLQRGDFTLLDDKHPVELQSFQAWGQAADGSAAAPQTPTQIILVIDTVNIRFQEVSFARFGIDQFLRRDGGKLAAPVSIYWYTDTGLVGGAAPSTDGNAVAAQLDATEGHLRSISRSAGAWGAIERFEMSVRTVSGIAHAAAAQPGRKLLIWIGPGWPMLDSPGMQMTWKDQQRLFGNIVDLSTAIRQAHLQLYSVTPGMPNSYTYLFEAYTKGVKKPTQANLPNLDLKVLAVQSGGQALPPNNDLADAIKRCARDAGPYYSIAFTPPPADGPSEYHDLKVSLDKPGLAARTNTGYYNQPLAMPVPR